MHERFRYTIFVIITKDMKRNIILKYDMSEYTLPFGEF